MPHSPRRREVDAHDRRFEGVVIVDNARDQVTMSRDPASVDQREELLDPLPELVVPLVAGNEMHPRSAGLWSVEVAPATRLRRIPRDPERGDDAYHSGVKPASEPIDQA